MIRKLSPTWTGVALAAALAVSTAPLGAQELPKRKSGLWEMTMSGGMVVSQCIDHSRDDAFRQMGQQLERESKCVRSNVQRSAGSFSFDSTCDFGGSKMTSHTQVTGDLDSSYRMEVRMKHDPPLTGKADGTTTIEAKWVGACKPGQRPGDMVMPGGMTMNVYDMIDSKKK